MSNAVYQDIYKYVIHAQCIEPLHVGSVVGDKSEVLIHPVDDMPFIQASSICGVLRSYCEKTGGREAADRLFGNRHRPNGMRDDNDISKHQSDVCRESRIRISDGKFLDQNSLRLELRPRVELNNETGTVYSATLKGNGGKSGQKLNTQYVAAGAEFIFSLYLFDALESERKMIMKSLTALHAGEIQMGGLRSNGCGYVAVKEVKYRHYDMTDAQDRHDWITESDAGMEIVTLGQLNSKDRLTAYEIVVHAETENEMLVKGIAVEDFSQKAPKAVNMKNAAGSYIIPGSSIKGAIRSRMKAIAEYMGVDDKLVTDGFGMTGTGGGEGGKMGCLTFRDIIIGKNGGVKENQRTRIHIDKFTGGVMNGGLFSELNVSGNLDIKISISDRDRADAVVGLLLLAIRDLGCKAFALGSGQNVGRGYVDVHSVNIEDVLNNEKCSMKEKDVGGCNVLTVADGTNLIKRCMDALNQARQYTMKGGSGRELYEENTVDGRSQKSGE